MTPISPPRLAAASALLLPALLQLPAQAHGGAGATALAGLVHPLIGLDHLLMLIAVGAVAALQGPWLLLWALLGGVAGALLAQLGWVLPALELAATLAVLAVGSWALLQPRLRRQLPATWLDRGAGALVAAAVMLHALLHGLEAPSTAAAAWWASALFSSALVCAGTLLWLRPRLASLAGNPAAAFASARRRRF